MYHSIDCNCLHSMQFHTLPCFAPRHHIPSIEFQSIGSLPIPSQLFPRSLILWRPTACRSTIAGWYSFSSSS